MREEGEEEELTESTFKASVLKLITKLDPNTNIILFTVFFTTPLEQSYAMNSHL